MNKNRLNPQCNPKEQEMDELFYWVMSAIEFSVHSCWPAKTSHSVTLREPWFSDDERVMLEYGDYPPYVSQYVTREEFYSVMQEVAEVFNEIGKNEEDGYHFWANCYTGNGSASLTVNMCT